MNIYLIRHGDSEKVSSTGKDFDRHLTTNGKLILLNAVEYWKEIIPSIGCIFSSPYLRAVETAAIIKYIFGIKEEVIKDQRLAPGSNTMDLINLALDCNKDSIAFVGHQPDCSDHISQLTSGSGVSVSFSPAAIAGIKFSGKVRLSAGILEFLIPPSVCA